MCKNSYSLEMVRYATRRTTAPSKRRFGRKRYGKTSVRKRSIASGNRALRIAKSVSRKVAGELCKWQATPDMYTNYTNISGSGPLYWNFTQVRPLATINSGDPWIMPLNWIYTAGDSVQTAQNIYVGTVHYPVPLNVSGNADTQAMLEQVPKVSARNPIWYNTLNAYNNNTFTTDQSGAGLQYRLAYIYIRGIFNASVNNSTNNTDGAVRFVIVKDKQPQGGSATWYDRSDLQGIASRGVFSANLIDAQLNPKTTGRFKILYDKTLRFNTINGYKPFKYFKRISTIVRNTRNAVNHGTQLTSDNNDYEHKSAPPPVLKNAFYLMIYSDGPTFTYSTNSSTPAAGFHIMSRIGYYNN